MKIKTFAEVLHANGAALDMPTGSALAPRGFPKVVPVFRPTGFPESKVGGGIAIVFVRTFPRGVRRRDLSIGQAGQTTITIERAYVEINRAILGLIGFFPLDQSFDQGDLLGNMSDRRGFDVRSEKVQGLAILMKALGPPGREFAQGNAFRLRLTNRLVVNVGQVAGMVGLLAGSLEYAPKNILHDESPEISDVSRPVNSRPATVEPNSFSIHGKDLPVFPGQGIVELERHALLLANGNRLNVPLRVLTKKATRVVVIDFNRFLKAVSAAPEFHDRLLQGKGVARSPIGG